MFYNDHHEVKSRRATQGRMLKSRKHHPKQDDNATQDAKDYSEMKEKEIYKELEIQS